MLRLEGVRKSLGGRLIIERASLSVKGGELLCLVGPSGSGKTTLLELMAGILSPDEGAMVRACPAALAFQDDALAPWLDAAGNLDYALSSLPRRERESLRNSWLERFGLPGGLRPDAMSGGMRRRLNLARAFASGRRLMLLDEPFAFLDAAMQSLVSEEICRVSAEGGAVVVVTHQSEPLEGLNCRIVSIQGPPVLVEDRLK